MNSSKIIVNTTPKKLDKIVIKTPFFRRNHMKGTVLKCMFNVPKDSFTVGEWKRIIHEHRLILSPILKNKFAKAVEYPSYLISSKYVSLPREFGIKLFGKPEQDLTDSVSWYKGNEDSWLFNGVLRPYQEIACEKLISNGCGILCAGCGTGKTTMSIYSICQMKRKTIILLHKEFLLQQWKERLSEYAPGLRVGVIQQSCVQIDDYDVVLAMIQTVISDYKQDISYDSFELCVIDECHHLCCRTFIKSMRKMSCPRIGLTATLERQDGLSYSIMNEVGDVVCDIKRNVHCEVDVFDYATNDPKCTNCSIPYATLTNNICDDDSRNNMIADIVHGVFHEDSRRIILVISSRKSLLRTIHDKLIEKGIDKEDIGYYMGCVTKKQKEERALSEDKRIILGTSGVCSEGLDIKKMNTVLLATPCKQITQITGRIMRGGSEVIPRIIDISDKYNYIFSSMSAHRFKQYKKEKYTIRVHTSFVIGKLFKKSSTIKQ